VNYRESLAWLYATQKFGIKLGLDNTLRLLAALRIEKRARIIHVAGTNGKGSVCAFIDAICRAAGFRTGLFTSPHLVSFRERIRVDGEMISEADVAHGVERIRDLTRDWDPHPTFFEITTALALRHFQNTECGVLVLETGMGGRLDATNATDADVSVITPIDLDHQKWLGDTLAEIAAEKAGIIKQNTPVICASQRDDAAEVIRARAAERSAPLSTVTQPWTRSRISLRGAHQKCNAALAAAAARALDSRISEAAIEYGLASAHWGGRFQLWNERIVLDGAHNVAGARVLARTWREEFGDAKATVLLAILRDKNARAMIETLAPIATSFVLPRVRSERAISSTELAELVRSADPSLPCSTAGSAGEAIAAAQRQAHPVLITGSLHFVGEALATLSGVPDALEDCAQ